MYGSVLRSAAALRDKKKEVAMRTIDHTKAEARKVVSARLRTFIAATVSQFTTTPSQAIEQAEDANGREDQRSPFMRQ